jgi:hypothetical protein
MSEVGGQFLARAVADAIGTEILPHYAFKRTLAVDPRAPPASAQAVPEDVVMAHAPESSSAAPAASAVAASSSSSSGGAKREPVYMTAGGKWRVQRADITGVTSSFHQVGALGGPREHCPGLW